MHISSRRPSSSQRVSSSRSSPHADSDSKSISAKRLHVYTAQLPKPSEASEASTKHKATSTARNAAEATNVPAPIPDTGPYATHPSSSTIALSLPTATSHSIYFYTSTPPHFSSELPAQTTILSQSPVAANADSQPNRPSSDSGRLSTSVIALLAVGSAFLLLGAFLILKVCCKPRPRPHPIPSNPIPQMDYSNSGSFDTDNSPIFGGKERFSPRASTSNGLLEWTQYTKPSISSSISDTESKDTSHFSSESHQAPFPIVAIPAPPPPAAPTTRLPTDGFPRGASRLSTISMSVYPGSPASGQVGVALTTKLPAFADDRQIYRRSQAEFRRSQSSALGPDRFSSYAHGNAYDGADVCSPSLPRHSRSQPLLSIPPSPAATGGRSRIKSSNYHPASYYKRPLPGASKDVPSNNETLEALLQSIPIPAYPLERSQHSAPSLKSPSIPGSPLSHPSTIFPDDSMSVVGIKPMSSKRGHKKPVPQHSFDKQNRASKLRPMDTPVNTNSGLDASAALGSLMMMDFDTVSNSQAVAQIDSVSPQPISSRIADRPPRVPSPDPLPSLAQMALEHGHPETYDHYRSPTYSIYGLYQAEDRKSRVGG